MSNAPSPSPAPVGDFASRIHEAQRQLGESVAAAGLQRDPYRFPLEAMATVVGTFPEFVARLEATRQPFRDEDLRRLERAAATGADRRAMELARAANWKTLTIGVGILLLFGAACAVAGYRYRGAPPNLTCQDQQDGSRVCYVFTRAPTHAGAASSPPKSTAASH